MKKKIFLLLLSCYVFINIQGQWVWKNPTPQGNDLKSCSFISPAVGFAAGYSGTFMKTTDAGNSWTIYPVALMIPIGEDWVRIDFNDIVFFDSLSGYALSPDLNLLKTRDGGKTWNWVSFDILPPASAIAFPDAAHGYLVSDSGKIYFSGDSCLTWQSRVYPTNEYLSSVSFPSSQTGYICGYGGSVIKTQNGGDTWNSVYSGNTRLFSTSFISATHGCAVGDSGKVLITYDGGITWDSSFLNNTLNCKKVCMVNDSVILINATSELTEFFMMSNDSGNTWNVINSGLVPSGFYSCGNGNVFGVGKYGLITKSSDFGNTWNNLSNNITYTNGWVDYIADIEFPDAMNGFALYTDYGSNTSLILKTTDAGNSWAGTDTIFPVVRSVISFTTPDVGLLMGHDIYKTSDAGKTWHCTFQGTWQETIMRAADFSATNGIAVYDNGGPVFRTADMGESWTKITNIPGAGFHAVSFANDSVCYLSGDSTILKSEDTGLTWNQVNNAQTFYNIDFINAQTGYGSGSGIFKTTDGGFSWVKVYEGDKYIPLDFYDQDTGYAAINMYLKKIIKTTNGGISWSETNMPLGFDNITSLCVAPDGHNSFAGADKGFLFGCKPENVADIKESVLNPFKTDFYPNPAKEKVNIDFQSYEPSVCEITIMDLYGHRISSFSKKARKGANHFSINTQKLDAGTYLYQVLLGSSRSSGKFVVIK